jgi:hypothetical protein
LKCLINFILNIIRLCTIFSCSEPMNFTQYLFYK